MRPALPFSMTLSVLAMLLSACGSPPPKPPEVDESTRRPANTSSAVELQVCRSNLQNTRILANEASRAADITRAQAALVAQTQQPATPAEGNAVHLLLFGFGSSRLEVPQAEAQRIVEAARTAPLVVLRGRTDGLRENGADSRIARERTAAVQAWLIASGVDPSRIRATWQPVGDTVADNTTEAGRTLNRRVEIEIYRTAPRFVAAGSPANP